MRKILLVTVACLLLALLVFIGFLSFPHRETIRHEIVPVLRETITPTLKKTVWKYGHQLRGEYPQATDVHLVEEYISANREFWQLERQLQAERMPGTPETAGLKEREELRMRREAVRPYAEAVVEQQVAAVLKEEGLVLLGGRVLPPPKYIFADSYYILVTSPRQDIRIEYTRLLGKDMPVPEQEELERTIETERPDLAALVMPVGGLAVFYPAQIYHRGSIRWLLELSVHEWLHQYLYVASPLGRTYLAGGRMRTINETVANMLGREIGDRVYLRYYATSEERIPLEEEYREYLNELAARPSEAEEQPVEENQAFSFSSFMRETYQEAARLLDEGETEAAEIYMEERRQSLALEGYTIRKLNQAYFAFRGSYADSPTAVDNVGPALARLRLETSSPREYLEPLKKITSYAEFLDVMEEQGITVFTD